MRTRRSQSSGNPVSPLDEARDTPPDSIGRGHTPVLLHEALALLEIRPDDVVIDGTLGGAGHARAIAQQLGEQGTLIGFDLDHAAIVRAQQALAKMRPHVHLVEANFRYLAQETRNLGIANVTKALFDLGWSSYQLDSGRGFSFSAHSQSDSGGRDELLMTYRNEPSSGTLTAEVIVNEWAEESLADVIFGWGQEHYARRIAKAIVAYRARTHIRTARELAEVVRSAVPAAARRGKTHPATKTFQALRIAVNDELGALTEGLSAAWEILAPGGRIAVITFHSIEDGIVKRTFAELEKRGEGKRVTKKPLAPSREEVVANPRSRSAKLRVIEKL